MKETYGHELEGQIVIIETVPRQDGKRYPVGYSIQVRLENGLTIANVTQIDFAPIKPNERVRAVITLAHIVGNEWQEEQVTVEDVRFSGFATIVEEEKHE